jgi:alkylhydroperoxidase family enzyme
VSWIRLIEDASAEGAVREAYEEAEAARGRLSNILRVHGVHPDVLTSHLRLYVEVMFGRSELTRIERETIAVAVSSVNGCRY